MLPKAWCGSDHCLQAIYSHEVAQGHGRPFAFSFNLRNYGLRSALSRPWTTTPTPSRASIRAISARIPEGAAGNQRPLVGQL
jgi:hypothetical protein